MFARLEGVLLDDVGVCRQRKPAGTVDLVAEEGHHLVQQAWIVVHIE